MIRIPGMIDIRTQVNAAGEDWTSTTSAALAGGFTAIVAAADGLEPVVSQGLLTASLQSAAVQAKCDYAQLMTVQGETVREINRLGAGSAGFSLFTENIQHPQLALQNMHQITRAISNAPAELPLFFHGNASQIGAAIFSAGIQQRSIHIADIRTWDQLEMVLEAKSSGANVSCDVSAITLFLSQKHYDGAPEQVRRMLPALGTEQDRQAIWHHLDAIDCFVSGHDPQPDSIFPGFPALETALNLYLYAVEGGFLSLDDLILRTVNNPQRIFRLNSQPDTFVEIDNDERKPIDPTRFHSNLKVSPFAGLEFPGSVTKVVLRGTVVFQDGEVLASAGSGMPARRSLEIAGGS